MHLAKHHGLGNDFLVLLDLDGSVAGVDGDLAIELCDRHTGVGADGLLYVTAGVGDADVTMVLHNADGSRAEMSGNGIRCVAQAVVRARGETVADLVVATDAGPRRVEVRAGVDERTAQVRVDMGAVAEGPALDRRELPALHDAKELLGVDVGNPHAVALFVDPAELDAAADRFVATDRNVEFVLAPSQDDVLAMRVVERGVGETLACGTGACAAAWAAHRWGLVGEQVTVHMPGGSGLVELGATVHLTGPAVFVAEVHAWR